MGKYVFKKKRNIENKFKSLYSHFLRDILPAALGVGLLHVAYSEYYEFSNPNAAIWYLISGIVIVLYSLFRFWKLYKEFSAPRVKSFIIDEKGVYVDFNKYPYKATANWEKIERIVYFPGDVDEGFNYKVDYLEFTDFYGQFKDYRGADINQVVRILNDDWENEQEGTTGTGERLTVEEEEKLIPESGIRLQRQGHRRES